MLPVVVRLVLLSVITSAGDFVRNSFDELEFFFSEVFLIFLAIHDDVKPHDSSSS